MRESIVPAFLLDGGKFDLETRWMIRKCAALRNLSKAYAFAAPCHDIVVVTGLEKRTDLDCLRGVVCNPTLQGKDGREGLAVAYCHQRRERRRPVINAVRP